MAQVYDIVAVPFETVAATQFQTLSDRSFDRLELLQPKAGTVEDIANRYGLRHIAQKGRITTGDVQKSLTEAAFALNRAIGKRWTDGAVETVMPSAAKLIARNNHSNPERIAALYLAILEMPRAYSEFLQIRSLQAGHIVKKKDLTLAWSANQKCGVYPFC